MALRHRVLFVDDDENILNAFKRAFRKKYDFEIAVDPEAAIYVIKEKGPFTVIVSDMKMPKMDGAQFLSKLKNICPGTVRVMLTGNNDMQTAVDAVNNGQVFRFLSKPCSAEELGECIDAAIDHHFQVKGERDLLENTLTGCLQLLSDIVDASQSRIIEDHKYRERVLFLCEQMQVEFDWVMDVACSLIQVGAVTLPHHLVDEDCDYDKIDDGELEMLYSVPRQSGGLIEHIPRLLQVSRMLNCIGEGRERCKGMILAGAYASLLPRTEEQVRNRWDNAARFYHIIDPEIQKHCDDCESIESHGGNAAKQVEVMVSVRELRVGDVLGSHVKLADGKVLVSAGNMLTPTMLRRISNFSRIRTVLEPILVLREK